MYIEIHTTAKDMDEARKIASALVERKLAACVNMYPVTSIYSWQGKVEEEEEIALSIKSTSDRLEDIRTSIRAMHSYDLPAITFQEIKGDHDYLMWISDSTSESSPA
ncbi:MAG: periplasmic divalent cation tolerance protein [Methanolobus sp.]|jgi:periplasmic divalent cation tolerance protein|nr:periplasmic divalent cation tolerance protein [Methanolobus sp.]MDN5310328.1 periplasmic divalent cation tolerance protein [Methanolobus sp.]